MIDAWEQYITENTYSLDKDVRNWEKKHGKVKYSKDVKLPKIFALNYNRAIT